jgi:hypothetical protein
MKKLLISFLLIAFSLIGISQNSLENKLLEVYSEKQTKLILEDVQQKKYFNNIVFNSYKVEKITNPKIKKQAFVVLNTLDLNNMDGTITTLTPNEMLESVNKGTFNILRLRIERDLNEPKIYLLGNTNHTLKISSFKTLSKSQQ